MTYIIFHGLAKPKYHYGTFSFKEVWETLKENAIVLQQYSFIIAFQFDKHQINCFCMIIFNDSLNEGYLSKFLSTLPTSRLFPAKHSVSC